MYNIWIYACILCIYNNLTIKAVANIRNFAPQINVFKFISWQMNIDYPSSSTVRAAMQIPIKYSYIIYKYKTLWRGGAIVWSLLIAFKRTGKLRRTTEQILQIKIQHFICMCRVWWSVDSNVLEALHNAYII